MRWIYIDATREGVLVVGFRGGFDLVVRDGVAELAHRSRTIALLTIAKA